MDKSDRQQLAEAWDAFCDTLKAAKSVILDAAPDLGAQDQAAGIRMLARLIPFALDVKVENADGRHPEFTHLVDWRRKHAGDNQDGLYLAAPILPGETYRVTGRLGTAANIIWTVIEAGQTYWGGPPSSVLFGHQMNTDPDGRFVMAVGPRAEGPNALRTTGQSIRLMLRQFFADWNEEYPVADLLIERVGEPVPPPSVTVADLAGALRDAAAWHGQAVAFWPALFEQWRVRPLEFLAFHEMFPRIDATPGGDPYLAYWEMAADEALVIRVRPPRHASFWNFELGNWWLETMDYRYRLAGTNNAQASIEADGEVILVVSHTDPGVCNWLDASGYRCGYLINRWMEADSAPRPTIERVRFADLAGVLPPGISRISAEARQAQLLERRRGIMRRFANI